MFPYIYMYPISYSRSFFHPRTMKTRRPRLARGTELVEIIPVSIPWSPLGRIQPRTEILCERKDRDACGATERRKGPKLFRWHETGDVRYPWRDSAIYIHSLKDTWKNGDANTSSTGRAGDIFMPSLAKRHRIAIECSIWISSDGIILLLRR